MWNAALNPPPDAMMCAEHLPHVACPVCGDVVATWPQHAWVERCRRCRRPLILVPVRVRPFRVFRIMSLLEGMRCLAASLALLALACLVARMVPLPHVILLSAMAFAAQGIAELGDGVLGLRSNLVRNWGRLHAGHKARTASVAKCAISVILLLLAATGISLAMS